MPQLTAQFSNASDVLVITIGARRTDGEHITDAQKDAAMDAVLQIIGADVEANSTAILTNLELGENDRVNVSTSVSTMVVSSDSDTIADIDASVEELNA